ncbi:MAG: DNA-3-methyladenine glycosylase 2 family protein [Acidobacteria bacterium]|nr:DNA-3-methyladenine glycosylase 2 family protein [Acidobacteriota bacterium]
MTDADYARARRLLMRRDAVLAAVIRRIGPCGLAARQRGDHFSTLVHAIVSQQVSTKAAATIFARLAASCPGGAVVNPSDVDALSDAQLRGVGLSRQKAAYVRDLCVRLQDGRLDLSGIDRLDDEQVIARLTSVKGFGRWTAEMFLMFRLHRPDVLPVSDLGIVTAVQRVYRLRARPKPAQLLKLGEAWRPFRSVASWYLWQTLRNERSPRAADTRPRSR